MWLGVMQLAGSAAMPSSLLHAPLPSHCLLIPRLPPYSLDALPLLGASNMITAVLGAGYTGSYIFSQTIFTMKSGIKSNLSGLVIATVELAVFALPFSVVSVYGGGQERGGTGVAAISTSPPPASPGHGKGGAGSVCKVLSCPVIHLFKSY